MGTHNDFLGYEDDPDYLELRTRILLLVEDEDEDDLQKDQTEHWNRTCDLSMAMQYPHCYGLTSLGERAANQMQSYVYTLQGEKGSGTGVFIPQVKSRRRRSGRKKKRAKKAIES